MTTIYKPLQIQAYEFIKQLIENGELQYDTNYSESYFSNLLGFSKTPIKAALVRLNNEKMVDILPSRGIILHRITPNDLKNSLQMRCAIESYCARQIMMDRNTERGKKLILKLNSLLEKTYQNATDLDSITFKENDMDWHCSLISYSENADFINFFNSYSFVTDTIMKNVLFEEGRLMAAHNEHKAIYDAIVSGDEANIYASIFLHLDRTADILKSHDLLS